MEAGEQQPAKFRSRRMYIMWSVAIGLLVLIAAVSWTAVPIVQVHLVVRDTRLPEKDASFVARLGGEGAARERLKRCMYLADWLAPDRFGTATLLRCCPGGERTLVAILRDPQAPLDSRVLVPMALTSELAGDMDDHREWLSREFEAVLKDPCPQVRLAAADGVWRLGVTQLVDDRRLNLSLDAMIEAAGHEDPKVRLHAVGALTDVAALYSRRDLAEGRQRHRRAEAALKAALQDENPAVSSSAEWGLKQIRPRTAVRFEGDR